MDQDGSEKFEFTPIGYLKEKQNGTAVPSKRSNETAEHNHGTKMRKPSIDNSLDSMRMFNDTSQFDDTLPQLNVQTTNNNVKNQRNLIHELKENAQTSNPLKEQQEQMHRLTTDNYNLRLKCNSLLKFLNNVTDEGELKKSLNLLEEIQDWKQKYQSLNGEFMGLKRDYDDLEMKHSKIGEIDNETDGSHNVVEMDLRNKLQETETKLKQVQNEVQRLEQLHMASKDTNFLENQQYNTQVDMLKSDIINLNLKLHEKDKNLEEQKSKIYRLTNQLQEFDHKGSESLLKLENQLDVKNNSIKNLEKELVSLTHSRQSLETKLKNLEESYNELQNRYKNYDKEYQSSLILEKNDKIRELTQNNIQLNENIKKLNEEYNSLQSQIKNKIDKQSGISSLEAELKETKRKLDETTDLSKRLQKQIIDSTTQNAERNSQRVREKDVEIEELRRQIKIQEDQYDENVKSRIRQLNIENDLTQNQLSRKISTLQEEADSIKEAYENDIKSWKDKCNSLRKENDVIKEREQDNVMNIRQDLNWKTSEIERLNRTIELLRKDHSDTTETISRLQKSKEVYKEELKKSATKFEYLSKEFVKLKEKQSEIIHIDTSNNSSLKEKYTTMRQRLLDELKSLQEENLSLERRLLESRKNSQHKNKIPIRTNTSNQDRIDYYKLKYNTEVKQNNDLKIMNEYLNRVLRASSQHVRLDLLKIKNEVNDSVPSAFKTDYRSPLDFYDRRHLKFKTVALFILSCVRMKQAAVRRKWDDQRLKFLQRKITMDDDRISW